MRRSAAAIALALALATSGALCAQTTTCQPHLLGADRRGPAHALARSGTMVYLGAGAALVVIDTADPLHPIERGYANLNGVVRDVASWGWTAIALIPDAIEFVNANDPANPQVVGSFPLAPEWDVQTIDARDSMVFFTAPDGLHIVSFADPSAPEEIGNFAIAAARDVAARSGRAYLVAGGYLHVLDTTDPAAPVHVRQLPVPESADKEVVVAPSGSRLATWGGYTDGRHYWGAVGFFDLADPDRPVQRSSLYYDESSLGALALGGGRAYVSSGGSVEIFDLSDLAHPGLRGSFDTTSVEQIMVATPADYLLAAEPYQGFTVFDVATPQSAHEASAIGLPRPISDGYFLGSAAVTLTESGLRVFDVSDPTRPGVLGSLDLGPSCCDGLERILEVGSRAFGNSSAGLRAFDLSDLTQPREVEPLTGFHSRFPPVLDHGRLFTERQDRLGVEIYDVADPSVPVPVGEVSLATPFALRDFTARLDRLYVWDFETHPTSSFLRTYGVDDPANPVEIASASMHFFHLAQSAAGGDSLFLVDELELRVLRMTDPQHPALVADVSLPAGDPYARRLDLYGRQLLISPGVRAVYSHPLGDDRIFLFDVSNPARPAQVLALDTPGDGRGAFAGPGLIGVADGEAGFTIYASCVPLVDGFESGDTSAWSFTQP